MKKEILLSCVSYFVEVCDLQVIFTESRPIQNCKPVQLAFERPKDINDSNGIWYLCWLETGTRGVVASHIVNALKFCQEEYGDNFKPYKGGL